MSRYIIGHVLKRAEDLGLLFCFLALILVEAGYGAWLRRGFPAPEQPFNPLFVPWVARMAEGGVALLLTILGGTIAWSAFSLVAFFRSKLGAAATIDARRVVVMDRLKTAALYAALTGAYMFPLRFELQG